MTEAQQAAPHVYAAIAQVAGEIAKTGIAKDRKNEQQGYKFRGIDEVYNAMAPLLAESGLTILPTALDRICEPRETAKGGVIYSVTVKVDFAFVSAKDGSTHHVVTYGEAMDSGDKATNKAMSAAYKYACMQAFCIPTEGDNDADATTPPETVKPKAQQAAAAKPAVPPATEQDITLVTEALKKAETVAALAEAKTTKLAPLWPRLQPADREKLTKLYTDRTAHLALAPFAQQQTAGAA
jgi:hypothetical protein